MKKFFCLVAATVLLLSFAACNPVPDAKDTLTGTPEEILALLKETVDIGMTFDDEITPESMVSTPQIALGLTDEQFAQFVESAYEAKAMITTMAQRTAVVKCKDAAAAVQVKELVAEGFDSNQWICVFPDQSVVVESGSYVMLAVGTVETTNALAEAFKTLSGGNTGSPDVFFTFDGEGGGGFGGGELILP